LQRKGSVGKDEDSKKKKTVFSLLHVTRSSKKRKAVTVIHYLPGLVSTTAALSRHV
jgi:hypothetical protein